MIENLKGFLNLILIIVVSIILSNFFVWYISIFVAILIVIVIPPFVNVFYFQSKKLKNLPDVDAIKNAAYVKKNPKVK